MKTINENQFMDMVRESIIKRETEEHKREDMVFDEDKQKMVKRVCKTTLMKFYCPLHLRKQAKCDWYAVVSDKETDRDTTPESNVRERIEAHLELHGISIKR